MRQLLRISSHIARRSVPFPTTGTLTTALFCRFACREVLCTITRRGPFPSPCAEIRFHRNYLRVRLIVSSLRHKRLTPNHKGPTKLRAIQRDMHNATGRLVIHALIRLREYDCERLKDRVYCLTGLAAHFGRTQPFIHVDYRQRDEDVYVQTAINLLQESENLLPLYYAEGRNYRRLGQLPS